MPDDCGMNGWLDGWIRWMDSMDGRAGGEGGRIATLRENYWQMKL